MKVTAKKSLGQNFLINPHILDKIISAADIKKDDIILEIGPGTGNLTKELAEKASQIIAVEKDRHLVSMLKENFKNSPNVEISEDDVLKIKPVHYGLQEKRYKIVANIPYYITSNLIRKILEEWPQTKLILLMIQKEVAQRIVAKPPHMNLLALSVQYYTEPEIIGFVSKNNFRPVPKVDSAIIKLTPKPAIRNTKLFNLMKMGFSEKRKQLAGTLAKKLGQSKEGIASSLQKAGIEIQARPENLSIEDWQRLSDLLFR